MKRERRERQLLEDQKRQEKFVNRGKEGELVVSGEPIFPGGGGYSYWINRIRDIGNDPAFVMGIDYPTPDQLEQMRHG